VSHLPALHLDDASTTALCQGRSIAHPAPHAGLVRLYTAANRFFGLGQADAGQLVPHRLFATQQT